MGALITEGVGEATGEERVWGVGKADEAGRELRAAGWWWEEPKRGGFFAIEDMFVGYTNGTRIGRSLVDD